MSELGLLGPTKRGRPESGFEPEERAAPKLESYDAGAAHRSPRGRVAGATRWRVVLSVTLGGRRGMISEVSGAGNSAARVVAASESGVKAAVCGSARGSRRERMIWPSPSPKQPSAGRRSQPQK